MPTTPRILTLTGAPFPKALVASCDLATGTLVFNYLDAASRAVDSGKSIARFTPVTLTPANGSTPAFYADVSDAVLAAAVSGLV